MNVRSKVLALALFSLVTVGVVAASKPASQESVIRQYIKDWNDGALEAFLAQHAPDAKILRHEDDSDNVETQGAEAIRARYTKVFAKVPHVHVEIVSTTTVGDFVLNHEHVTNLPDGKAADEISMYQVRDGLIRTVWHLNRAISPDPHAGG